MRILHIFDHSLPLQSGYVTRSLGILRSQQARDWETVQLTTPRQGSTGIASETVDGFTFHRTPVVAARMPGVREFAEMRATYRVLTQLIGVHKPDVLHAHSPVLNVIPAIRAGRRFDLPVVYEVRAFWEDAAVDHGTTKEGSLRYRLSRSLDTWAMRRVDCVAPICEPLRSEIVARGIAPNRVVVVPNAVERSLLNSGGARDGVLRAELGLTGTVLGYMGSFYSYEGLDLLLEAAQVLAARGADFSVLLVGGGPDEDRLRQMTEQRSLGQIVRFAGRIPHAEIARYYQQIDLLVFPRKRMRLTELVTPLKPLEGMAQSVPVLASDVGGHRELIKDEQTGFLFPASSVEQLVQRLERLIADASKRQRVAQAGQLFIESERTWDRVAEKYAEIYTRALHRPSRRQSSRK